MKTSVRDTFDQLANIYEKSVDTTSLYNSEYERPSMLAQLPQDLMNMDILDAGCAAGWYSQQLMNRGANVTAIDISPEMVSSTIRRVGDKAQVLCMDLDAKLPFSDNSFDYIISSLTLHYIKDWSLPFGEFQRILKPNGVFLFSVHHPFSDIKLLENPNYFSTELIIDKWTKDGVLFEVPFYRRPLHLIINETVKHFTIEKLIEPQPTMKFKEIAPDKYELLMKNPQFLIMKAILN
jgi:ubiquinone/menaquinone biosynthesis C-methylase UbiE